MLGMRSNLPAYQVVYQGVYQGHLQGRYPTTSGVTPREPKADLADLADFSRGESNLMRNAKSCAIKWLFPGVQ